MISDDELKKLRKAPDPDAPAWTRDPATDKQLGYIKGLVEDRDIPETTLLGIKASLEEGLTKGRAGEIISELKNLPVKPNRDDRSKNDPKVQDIPPGRYAVQTGEHENDLTFYRVKRKERGEVKEKVILIIAGPTEHFLGSYSKQAKAAAKNIVRAGIGDSAVLYGRTIGRCSQCNTQITNRISRELGIGPICGGRVYDDWDSRVASVRESLLARGLDPTESVGN